MNLASAQRHLDQLNRRVSGLLTMNRLTKNRIETLTKRVAATEQAILELDAALRRSGAHSDGPWALSLLPSDDDPDRQSADTETTIST